MIGRKSKVAVEPGVELDYGNENHRRHIEDEAYSDPPRPRQKMKTPERSRFWWFWRFFGYIVFRPARRAWAYYAFAYYPHLPSGELGPWTRRFPSSEAVRNRLWGHGRHPVLAFLYWLFVKDFCICDHCGFTDFGEDYTIYPTTEDGEERTIELFDFLEGGGTDYFGEANDYSGWQWCYRCGIRSWETH